MQGPYHCFVVGAGHLQHELLVEPVADALYSINGGSRQLLLSLAQVQDLVCGLPPLLFEQVPDVLYGIQLTGVSGQEHSDE